MKYEFRVLAHLLQSPFQWKEDKNRKWWARENLEKGQESEKEEMGENEEKRKKHWTNSHSQKNEAMKRKQCVINEMDKKKMKQEEERQKKEQERK